VVGQLNFTEQADHAVSKATKAFAKVARLTDGRKALQP